MPVPTIRRHPAVSGVRRNVPLLAVAFGIALAACSPAAPDATTTPPTAAPVEAPTSATSTSEAPASETTGDTVAWANPDLPLPVTQLAAARDVIVYEAVTDGRPFLIGVDATSGTELYRLDAYPLSRLRAVTWSVFIDEARDQVVRRFFETVDGEDVARLAAHDLETGAELWRASAPWEAEQTMRCGNAYCLRADDSQFAYDPATGQLLDEAPIPDRRVLGSTPSGFVLTVDFAADGATVDALVGTTEGGTREVWRIPGDDLRSIGGSDVSPRNGWSDTLSPTAPFGTLFLGSPGTSGVTFGYDRDGGDLLWARPTVVPCSFAELSAPVACRVDASGATTAVVLLDYETGIDIWSIDLPAAAPEPQVVVSEGLVSVTTATDRFLVDLADGALLPAPAARLCTLGGEFIDVTYPEFGDVAYRTEELVTFCGPSGELLDPAAAYAENPAFAEQFLLATPSTLVGFGPTGGLVGIPVE